jgi:hypothetical protein
MLRMLYHHLKSYYASTSRYQLEPGIYTTASGTQSHHYSLYLWERNRRQLYA